MGVNSFLPLPYIYLSISLATPVYLLGSCLIFGQKLISGWVAIRISWCAIEKIWLQEIGTSISE